jgi:hypothetical protein
MKKHGQIPLLRGVRYVFIFKHERKSTKISYMQFTFKNGTVQIAGFRIWNLF